MTLTNKHTDSVRVYLQEIGRIKMLTPDEEIKLARQIKDLLELEQQRERLTETLKYPPTESEWATEIGLSLNLLRQRLYRGRKAKDKMVSANLRLVVSIAKKYQGRGLSFLDLIQLGTMGLIRATEKFDPERGYKFSTYATWWIRQACSRGIYEQSCTIRLPVHIWDKLNQIKQITKQLSLKLKRPPTKGEIATEMSIDSKQLNFILNATRNVASIDRLIGKEENTALGDLIAIAPDAMEENLENNLLIDDLKKVIDTLSPQEVSVIRLLYGLDDGIERSRAAVGRILKLSRERIRQIEANAIKKLQQPNRNKVLRDYIS